MKIQFISGVNWGSEYDVTYLIDDKEYEYKFESKYDYDQFIKRHTYYKNNKLNIRNIGNFLTELKNKRI